MPNAWLSLLGFFSLLSLLAVGGGVAVLPEMKQITVVVEHWLTNEQFRDIYSLGQLVPGPNMLMVIVIGYHVAGFLGAGCAFLGFFIPSSLLAWFMGRVWNYFAYSPWRAAVQRGLAPLVIGLMLAGTMAIARTAIFNNKSAILAMTVFIILFFSKKVNPALLILLGGALGWVLFRAS